MSNLKLHQKKKIVNEVMQLILDGTTYLEACKHVDIPYSEFLYWVTNIKGCINIKEQYEKQKQAVVESALFRAAVGFEYEEKHISKRSRKNRISGKVTEDEILQKQITKRTLPNVHAQMLFLTNKDPENWVTENGEHHDMSMQIEMLRQSLDGITQDNDLMEGPPEGYEEEAEDIFVENKQDKKQLEN